MKSKKPTIYRIEQPVMNDIDFKFMLEGIMAHRDNLVRYGTPLPPEKPDVELQEQRKRELEQQISECKEKIKELEDSKERYAQLLRVIYEEESRAKEEQRNRNNYRSEYQGGNYNQGDMY
ncbi:hypothetical protein M9Y10_022739 [Tritrichomonas musculus]|uniref:Uncharacterized protein n=1 Tax=Tritrichomonas musculus TaxID=1915356 RepID=A0ABR2KT86_9EUKA